MTREDAASLLDGLETRRGKAFTPRTRNLILRAVEAGVTRVSFHGLNVALDYAGIKIVADLLSRHQTAWMEALPDEFEPLENAPAVEDDPRPRFGL